jgi:cell division protein FtsI (penicillin-binding protein 3)
MMARGANRRVRILLFAFTLVFALILARATWLQSVRAQSLEKLALGQQQQTVELPAHRGTIFDRGGFQLAIGEQATTVYANPKDVTEPEVVARAAGRELGLNPDDVYRAISDRSKGFVYVKRQADPKAAKRLERMHLAGLGFYGEERRFYPQGRVGASLLGYAGVDNKGLAGLELSLDGLLAGRNGKQTVVKDPYGRSVDIVKTVPEQDGKDVRLTIDHTIQANAQLELWRAVHQWQAQSATAIVMNPRTGAILAMANAPGYDANDYPDASQELQRNKAVTDTYEPGSTFKLVTVAGVLSDGLVTPSSEFTLAPQIEVADRTIHEGEERDTVTYSVEQILAHSSNVGAITLAEILTKQPKRDVSYWISRFGFGHKTEIDFPGESAGIVLPPSQWTGATIGNVPIGHGIAVTPIQMAAAYAAIANGGVWVQPHLVKRVGGSPRPTWKRRRIVTKHVAAELTTMLRDVVIEGTGTKAEIPGYQVAGKTGTAAIPLPTGGYSSEKYVASFVGYVPASNPQLLVMVTVNQPQGAIFGGMVAAPVFQNIAKFDLQYLGVLPHQ